MIWECYLNSSCRRTFSDDSRLHCDFIWEEWEKPNYDSQWAAVVGTRRYAAIVKQGLLLVRKAFCFWTIVAHQDRALPSRFGQRWSMSMIDDRRTDLVHITMRYLLLCIPDVWGHELQDLVFDRSPMHMDMSIRRTTQFEFMALDSYTSSGKTPFLKKTLIWLLFDLKSSSPDLKNRTVPGTRDAAHLSSHPFGFDLDYA